MRLRIRRMRDCERLDPLHSKRSYKILNNRVILVGSGEQTLNFKFPPILGEESLQTDAFAEIKHLADAALQGKNCSVFAYGQTGSGKTFTVSGGEKKFNGIGQQTIRHIWSHVQKAAGEMMLEFQMVQVYKDELADLLKPDEEFARALHLVVDGDDNVSVEGNTRVRFTAEKDVESLIKVFNSGLDRRLMRSNDANEASSRSHLLFTIQIQDRAGNPKGKITFVDLAGSERVAVINLDTMLYEEALFINESLKYLGYIVRWLATGKPHRDLKFYLNPMTGLIRDSLGGSAQSVFYFCISPSNYDIEATSDTLRFA